VQLQAVQLQAVQLQAVQQRSRKVVDDRQTHPPQ
jgi:hypothetical protein